MPANLNLYDNFRLNQWEGAGSQLNVEAATIKMMLVTATYSVNQNTHVFKSSVTNEVSGTGYTARGNSLASPIITLSGAGLITFDAADPATWTQNGAGFSNARRAIIYADTGTDSTSRLIAYSDDFGADLGNTVTDLIITIDANGIFTNPR